MPRHTSPAAATGLPVHIAEAEITAKVARLVNGGFQTTRGLARRFGCQLGQIVAAFAAIEAANPPGTFVRVYGAEAGGMGRV